MDATRDSSRRNIFLFPLGTVLFPGGLLPLKIFEQRYLEMTKACLRDNLPFGVCLIREGLEVGTPAAPQSVGCLATIEQWDMPHTGMFHLMTRGSDRFRIHETSVAPNGLLAADVEMLPAIEPCTPDPQCAELIKRVIQQVGAENFPQPLKLDEGAWVAYRLAEMLPFPLLQKQRMLEMETAAEIFIEIEKLLKTSS